MTIPTTLKKTLALTATLAVVGLLLAADASAADGKKKKKKKSSTTETTTEEATTQAEPPKEVKQARAHLAAFQTESAREALEPLANSNDAVVLTTRGRVDAQAKNYDSAVAALKQAADIDAASPAPSLYLGDAFAYSAKTTSANDAWKQAEARAKAMTAANPDSVEGLYFLGAAQQRQKKFADAAATFERARSLAPKDPEIAFESGVTFFYLEKWQQAFDSLSAAIDKSPDFAYAYYYRGMAAGKLDRKDLLFNDLDRFVKMAPEAAEAASAKQILSAFK